MSSSPDFPCGGREGGGERGRFKLLCLLLDFLVPRGLPRLHTGTTPRVTVGPVVSAYYSKIREVATACGLSTVVLATSSFSDL
jgi:hypothetical protein